MPSRKICQALPSLLQFGFSTRDMCSSYSCRFLTIFPFSSLLSLSLQHKVWFLWICCDRSWIFAHSEAFVIARTLSVVVYESACYDACSLIHRRSWCNICETFMLCQNNRASTEKRRRARSHSPMLCGSIAALVQLYAILSLRCNRMRNGTSIIIERSILQIPFRRAYLNDVHVVACANSKCALLLYSITFFRLFRLLPFSFSHANTLHFFFASNFSHLFSLRSELH